MLLYGAGGHAKVIHDTLLAQNCTVAGVFDDRTPVDNPNMPFLGTYTGEIHADLPLIVSIGNNEIRQKIALQVRHRFGKAIHPSAILGSLIHVGEGTVVLHRAVLQASAIVGAHCIINTGAIVEHDCHIADYVHVAPGSVLCGGVEVGECTLIGANATVTPYIKIGKNCLIGAGAVITRNLPDNTKITAGSTH